MHKFVRTPRGLTLVEMLGAMVVSSILLSSAWQLLHGGMRSYHHGLQDVRMTQGARVLLRLITRDLQRAMAARVPYGIRGAAPQPLAVAAGEDQTDRLAMLTRPALAAPGEEAGQRVAPQRIRYILSPVPDSNMLALQRGVGTTSEQQKERLMPVPAHMHEFRVRYFDGQTWYDAWQRAELPRAVEITLVMQSARASARAARFATLVTAD